MQSGSSYMSACNAQVFAKRQVPGFLLVESWQVVHEWTQSTELKLAGGRVALCCCCGLYAM